MKKPWRYRNGYLWTTKEEIERIDKLIDSSGIFRTNNAIRTRADFVRIATIVLGELLSRKRLIVADNADQEKVIARIVKFFCK